MMLGSLFLAPLADRMGRRPLVLASLTLVSLGMLGSSVSIGLYTLAATRLISGLGIGAMLAGLTATVAELTPENRRALAISLLQTAYPVGAILGGMISAGMIAGFGWRSVFVLGGVLPAMLIPVVLFALPESLSFLAGRRNPDSLTKINATLRKLKRPLLDALPPLPTWNGPKRGSLTALMVGQYRHNTVLIICAYVMVMMTLYFVLNWTPKIVVDSGLSVADGIRASVLVNIGGVIGASLFGLLATRFAEVKTLRVYMLLCVIALIGFGLADMHTAMLWVAAFIMGCFLHGITIGLYTLLPRLYAAEIRSTGAGLAIGVGRFGAIIGPALAGYFFEIGLESATVYALFTVPILLGLVAVTYIKVEP
jgi:MFS family permease